MSTLGVEPCHTLGAPRAWPQEGWFQVFYFSPAAFFWTITHPFQGRQRAPHLFFQWLETATYCYHPTTPPLRFRFLQGGSRADSNIYMQPLCKWPQNCRKYMGFHCFFSPTKFGVILPNLYLVCRRWPLNRGLHGREGVQERNKGWNAGNQLVYTPEDLHGTCPHGGSDHFPF